MSARTKARKRAIDMLYAADVRGDTLEIVLEREATIAVAEPDRAASWLYARDIVDGISGNRDAIDEQIETYAQGWTVPRMPTVDRAIIRIGVWELLYNEEIPAAVAIDEAVEHAKILSTDDSPGFVNGLLAKIARANGLIESPKSTPPV